MEINEDRATTAAGTVLAGFLGASAIDPSQLVSIAATVASADPKTMAIAAALWFLFWRFGKKAKP